MKGYLARDLNGSLWFHYVKPHRVEAAVNYMYWESNERSFQISDDDFPEFKKLKWQDKPISVGFNIHTANIQD
jgi:hypothetical protein